MTDLSVSGIRFREWIIEKALPFWAKASVNPAGGFHEKLTLDGNPVTDCPRRVRVQARMTYVYACAAHYGWYDKAREVSDHGWRFLLSNGMQGGTADYSGIAHLLHPDGSLLDGTRDTYAHAFLLLAAAWRVKAFDDAEARSIIIQTCDFLDKNLTHPSGGWREGLPAVLPRRQNPHMHLFEAFLACFEATGEEIYLQKVHKIFDLFRSHFFNSKQSILREFFTEDWSPDAATGHLLEPGHMMEWAWLLNWYQRVTGRDTHKETTSLFETSVRIGCNPVTGLLYDQIAIDGTLIKPASRSWTATEYVKACLASPEPYPTEAGAMTDRLLSTYLTCPIEGGWYDQVDERGNVIDGFMETSTFYHWMGMAVELDAALKKKPA